MPRIDGGGAGMTIDSTPLPWVLHEIAVQHALHPPELPRGVKKCTRMLERF
jgi:hypothetical protein